MRRRIASDRESRGEDTCDIDTKRIGNINAHRRAVTPLGAPSPVT